MAEYKDPVIQKLIDVLNLEGPSELKNKWTQGDILIAPKGELPMAYIAKAKTSIVPEDNMEDGHNMDLVIVVIWDFTEGLGQSSNLEAGVNALYRAAEGRDEDYQLLPDSIAYILRKYQQLDENIYLGVGPNQEVAINYGLGINRRGGGIFSVEAQIRVNARVIKLRTSRL